MKNFRAPTFYARLALILVTVIWGSTFPLTKMVLSELPPFLYLAIRYGLAAAIMLLFFSSRILPGWRRSWLHSVPIGAVLGLGYLSQTAGVDLTTASKAGFLTGLSVVLVPLFQALFFKKRPKASSLLGTLGATVGLALLSGFFSETPGKATDASLAFNLGDAYVLICAVMFALHILLIDRLPENYPRETVITQQFLVVALLALTAGLIYEPLPATIPSLAVWALVFFLALFATVCAYAAQTWAQKFLSANHTALILILEPVFSVVFSWLWLNEQLSEQGVLGALLIVLSMLGSSIESTAVMKAQAP